MRLNYNKILLSQNHWFGQQSSLFLFPGSIWFHRTATCHLNINISSSLWCKVDILHDNQQVPRKTFKKICLMLPKAVSSDGQLYIAMSRVQLFYSVTMASPSRSMYNSVYQKVLDTNNHYFIKNLKSLKFFIRIYEFAHFYLI